MQEGNVTAIRSTLSNEPGMEELIELFVNDAPNKIARLTRALEQEELEAVRDFAHQLKGAAGGYGFDALTPLAHQLELTAAAATASDQLKSEADRVIAFLDAIVL